MMSFFSLTHQHQAECTLSRAPWFQIRPRLSSKRTHLVHQQHSAPGSESTGVGLTGERARLTGLQRGTAAVAAPAETTLVCRSLRTRLRHDRTRGRLFIFVSRGKETPSQPHLGVRSPAVVEEGVRCSSSPTQSAARSACDAGDARRAGSPPSSSSSSGRSRRSGLQGVGGPVMMMVRSGSWHTEPVLSC